MFGRVGGWLAIDRTQREESLTLVLCTTDSVTMGEIWSSFSVGMLGGLIGAGGTAWVLWLVMVWFGFGGGGDGAGYLEVECHSGRQGEYKLPI